MSVESGKRYYPGLDLVRFASAMLVVFYHLGFSTWAKPASRAARVVAESFTLAPLGWIGFPGWIGVQIFFVVSGVVITQSANGRSPIEFAKGRLYRLYPAVWICATITLISGALTGVLSDPLRSYVHSMLLLPAQPWVDGQYWTLPVELCFYFLVFLLLTAKAFSRVERLAIGLIGLTASFMGLLYVSEALHSQLAPSLRDLTGHKAMGLPIYNGCFFGLGILISLWSRGRISRLGVGAGVVALLVGVWQIIDHHLHPSEESARMIAALAPYWLVPVAIFLLAVAAISWSITERFSVAEQYRGPIRALGLATYPLYLLHLTNGALVMRWFISEGFPPIAAFLIAVLTMTVLSVVIAIIVEEPVRRVLSSVIDRLDRRVRLPTGLRASGVRI